MSLDSSTPEVTLDTNQMSQVLINLIINACQAMPTGGKLKVRTTALVNGQEEPEKVRIEVTDTGEGIPPDNLESVFTPFFTTKHSGTGLGLSVSQRIVRSHQGEIRGCEPAGRGNDLCGHIASATEGGHRPCLRSWAYWSLTTRRTCS